MTSPAVTDVRSVAPIGHGEAMALAETEAARLLDVTDLLDSSDWVRPTDCAGWDVKALLSHVLGAMEANASPLDFFRQFRSATSSAKRSGRPMIDEMTACQVRDHAALSPEQMARRIHDIAPRAVRGRRRVPAILRARTLPLKASAPFGPWKLGYLVDVVMNRDFWMHRVDLTRATAKAMVLSADHDGRIVADVVTEWASTHGQPFVLHLEGPAGGSFSQGEGGEVLHLDAVEFCRVLSGRADGSGLLATPVPF
ncbi:MAG TPA: maleylpyruvate isomerase family mycothiol-dependent enzyme [Acidimicrobiales bacterium]|nr:maleylpyruvate isomerase family mycothiol-dependent enzyme [Acidimicrobiales bacterium]